MFAVESNGHRASAAKPASVEAVSIDPEPIEPDPDLAPSLETIYQDAHIKPSPLGYDILRAAEMAGSPHLEGMSQEAKRNALLMALQAAGVDLNFIVADAISRQRALNDHEDGLFKKLKEFEAEKARDSSRLQAELDRLMAQCKSRIKANLDDVAKEQDEFHAWQKRRHLESQRIVGTAMLLVPPDTASGGDSLAALLDRATSPRK
jgi:hypothetical protein